MKWLTQLLRLTRCMNWVTAFLRPNYTVLDIYGLERETDRYLICHPEVTEQLFHDDPIYAILSGAEVDLPGGVSLELPLVYGSGVKPALDRESSRGAQCES